MNDETQDFLNVTQAAEKMYEALRELKRRTEDYSVAGEHLDTAAATVQTLADETTKALEEQSRRWDALDRVLEPSLASLRDAAEKQTTVLSSLREDVAEQHGQLALLRQTLSDNSQALSEVRSSLGILSESSGRQARSLEEQGKTLGQQQATLAEVASRARNATYVAAGATALGFVAVVMLVVLLAS